MGPKFKSQELLLASIVCPICCEVVVDPRSLPCLHDFCVSCLETYCKSKESSTDIPCPVCRNAFSIPLSGLQGLPLNCFVASVLEQAPSSRRPLARQASFDEGEDDSSLRSKHGNLLRKSFFSKTNSWSSKAKSSPRFRTYSSRTDENSCATHEDEDVTLHCCECDRLTCLVCHATDHRFHAAQSIREAAAEVRRQLREKEMILTRCLENSKEVKSSAKAKALQDIAQVRAEVAEGVSLLRAQLDQYENQMNLKLEQVQRDIDTHYDKIEQETRELEEAMNKVKKSCQYLRTGGDLEVMEKFRELSEAVTDMIQSQQQTLESASLSQVARFSRGFCPPNFTNLIGEILINSDDLSRETSNKTLRYQRHAAEKKESSLDVASCKKPVLVSSRTGVSVLEVRGQVRGVTVLNDQLYVVVRNKPRVYIYRSYADKHTDVIDVEGLLNSSSLVSCSYYNYLYISDPETETVYQIDATSNSLRAKWKVADMAYNILSVSPLTHLLLVPLFYSNSISKYSPDGSSVQSINLPRGLDHPKHCLHMWSGLYLICHQGAKQHRVCLCSERGEVLAQYGAQPGLSGTQLDGPWCSVVDSRGFIYVADFNNNIVLTLNSQLHRLGPLGVLTHHALVKPGAMHFDLTCDKLVIGEYDSSRILIVSTNKNKTN